MPRIIRRPDVRPRPRFEQLVRKLADELRSDRESGQPLIEEKHASGTDTRSVNVYWDEWDGVPEEDRIATILRAYEDVFGSDYSERIVLAAGYTIPEGRDYGLLPFAILSGLRKTDPIPEEVCRAALIEEGGSILDNPASPDLRFPTMQDAKDAVNRLNVRLPGSRDIWIVAEDVRKRDFSIEDE